MSEVSDKMKLYLESEVGKSVLTLLAYTVNATETTKDDEIVANVDEVVDIIAEAISNINSSEVDVKEAKAAAALQWYGDIVCRDAQDCQEAGISSADSAIVCAWRQGDGDCLRREVAEDLRRQCDRGFWQAPDPDRQVS